MKKTEHAHYNPGTLLDSLQEWFELRTDAALARRLGLGTTTISKIRNRRHPVSAEVLLRMHEASTLPIRDLRFLAGDFRLHTGDVTAWIAPAAVLLHLSTPTQACLAQALKRGWRHAPAAPGQGRRGPRS